MMSIRVLAVSAPDLVSRGVGRVLSSSDPASLFNACRLAALHAENGIGPWADSNWACTRRERRASVMLMRSFEEDVQGFIHTLERIRPNLLLIGAMTICFRGALELAKIAREVLGEKVAIVLGGRHASETIYTRDGRVYHHPASPVRLMSERAIPAVFDLVVSGEAEALIPFLGARVSELEKRKIAPASLALYLEEIETVAGTFIVSSCDKALQLHDIISRAIPIVREELPTPAQMFGVSTSFDVFEGRLTAHVFSDTGSGCAFDCPFCSERRSVTGELVQLDTSARRLAHQLLTAHHIIRIDDPEKETSAFVEDSTLLAGSIPAMTQLARMLDQSGYDIVWGAQLTVDQVLRREAVLRRLFEVGLRYLFIGIETPDPETIGGMSKDTQAAKVPWMTRVEQVLEMLSGIGIQCGSAVLFGLGETHRARMAFLDQLTQWYHQYKSPAPISMNWAVQHPLHGEDGGMQYTYTDWATPAGPFLEAFRDFGEASVLYPIAGQPAPVLSEVQEVQAWYHSLVE